MNARSALAAAAGWEFNPPTTGSAARQDDWDGTVPVVYSLDSEPGYGKWAPYIPGPHEVVPWIDPANVDRSNSNEALADGGIHLAGSGLQLLTPLSDG